MTIITKLELHLTDDCYQWLESQMQLDGYTDLSKEIEDILEILVLKEDE